MTLQEPSASAASAYDNTLAMTSVLQYRDENGNIKDVSDTWHTHMQSACGSTVYNDFLQALDGGAWAVSQQDGSYYGVTVVWSKPDHTIPKTSFYTENFFNPPIRHFAVDPGWQGRATFKFNSYLDVDVCDYSTVAANNPWGSTLYTEGAPLSDGLYMSTYAVSNYDPDYEGPTVPAAVLYIDDDQDGLTLEKEVTQDTSDDHKDTDGDGLNDYIESDWYLDKVDVFCGTQCAEPDPTMKDVYVEIDWMVDGIISYEPNSTQIEMLTNAFAAKNINLHVDTGQYGQGNGLPEYIETLNFAPNASFRDFFDLKNGDEVYDAQFNESRKGIWRYMIAGYTFDDGAQDETSGVSYGGDDDLFVSLGLLRDKFSDPTEDEAIAGTMMHELGHVLCLTNSNNTYSNQASSCVFNGVDNHLVNYPNYDSSMNYDEQFSLVGYSNGANESNDHNDWQAVMLGMDDFISAPVDPSDPSFGGRIAYEKEPIYETNNVPEAARKINEEAQRAADKSASGALENSETEQTNGQDDAISESTAKQDGTSGTKQGENVWANGWAPLTILAGSLVLAGGFGVWILRRRKDNRKRDIK